MLVSVALRRLLNNMKQKIISLIRKLWHARWQFAKYFAIGLTAFLLDIGSLYLLKDRLGFSPVQAVIINQPLIILFVFWTNKKWSFQAAGQTRSQLTRFIILSLTNYGISIIWMWFFAHKLGFNYLIAKLANVVLAVSWNFLAYKYWVYAETAVHKPQNPLLTD